MILLFSSHIIILSASPSKEIPRCALYFFTAFLILLGCVEPQFLLIFKSQTLNKLKEQLDDLILNILFLKLIKLLIFGYDNVLRLSQYIGEFQPAAQTKCFFGCKIIALICRSSLATCFATFISFTMYAKI